MQCPKCQFENREEAQFCSECGHKFELSCPKCGNFIRESSKFCDGCGCKLESPLETFDNVSETESLPLQPAVDIKANDVAPINGERKQVTVLFSDLTGYTSMSEKLDPEEVKEITSRIFGEISKIVANYDGFIEKYAGDAVMVIFGVPKAHEDDPIRAVKAAREIHVLVDAISPDVESKIGHSISMHTGINTGLVVTGEVDIERGTHGVAGDTLNVASRLCSVAKAGEIIVGQEVFRQTFGDFTFEGKEPIQVKGKAEPLLVYKVASNREEPASHHGFSVLRAQLIGRKPEMTELMDAVANLKKGTGRIFSISGEAGTGKSRLVEELRTNVDEYGIQWLECHAYPYTQNIPYFSLIDLLNRIFNIEEEDPPETVRQKIELGIASLLEEADGIIPYIGSLYAIDYPEATGVSPEFWKAKLQESMKAVLSALALRSPTVFLLENLHWADPSYVELLQHTLLEVREPAIVLCIYRPTFSLFTSHQLKGMEKIFREIQLQPLSSSETQDMVTSLLMTDRIPAEVRRLVQEKAEGNPFYVEEMVNSLIESEILLRDGESWKLTGPIRNSIVSSTIHGIIGGRLDRLEKESKQVLQEASVIGRSFLYEILQKISTLQHGIDSCMRSLEQMDFIRTKALHPDLEYVFKHALTQEVAYNGLLKSHRREIHERIALVMEQLFSDRLLECYEALAYHYSKGSSVFKAVEYLVKSGEKSHKRYSLEEAHQYFKDAYELLSGDGRTKEKDQHIIDLLIKWGYVHNCRADYKGLEELLLANEDRAQSTGDQEKLGMFYAWLGWALRSREKLREGYAYLTKALHLGEKNASQKVIGYACAWLSWTCADRGLLDEALKHGKRAQELIEPLQSDGEFVRFTLAGLGVTHYFRGDCVEALEIGEQLLRYGQRHSDLRCMTMGHTCTGFSQYVAGSHNLAIQSFQNAIQVSADTVFTNGARLFLAMTYVADEQLSEAEGTFKEIMRASEDFGIEFLGTAAQIFYGVIQISQGNLNKGLGTIEHTAEVFMESDSRYRYATAIYTLGKVFARVAGREGDKSLSLLAKNIGFLVKNIPLAAKKAESHFSRTIEVAREIGAKGTLGLACLDLGLLYKLKKKPAKAREYISESIEIFQQCEAEAYLKKAKNALKSL